jgi:DNA-directed RNA polymerase specialized sigma24 family protein
MAERREIDERDIDQLLKALTDRQIADLFGMSETEVMQLRQSRQSKLSAARPERKKTDKS